MSASIVPQPRIEQRYVPLLIGFFVVVVLTAGFIFYTAFGKTNITVSTIEVDEDQEFIYSPDEVGAFIAETTFEHVYTHTGFAEASEPGEATGTVTLRNDHTADQPLVATTRLLGEESGVLFRTRDTVTVPAGGSIDVEVYADELGGSGNIGPDKFEIVALNSTLKPLIYAESSSAMTGGLIGGAPVTQPDLEEAIELAEIEMDSEAVVALQATAPESVGAITPDSVTTEYAEQKLSVQEGDIADTIVVTTQVTALVVSVDKERLAEAITDEVKVEIAPQRIEYEIEAGVVNEDDTVAEYTITATAPVQQTIEDISFIKKGELTGMSASQIEQRLLQYEQIEAVTVEFNPFWVRTTPLDTKAIVINRAE